MPPARLPAPAPAGEADASRSPARLPFRLGFRPELDGLRGLAVILVVTYHVGVILWREQREWLLPGGFLGVDLFFALSGFLITALLLAEAGQHGRVALGSFAERRIRRLVPALVGLLAALLALALAGKMYDPAVMLRSAATVLTFSHNWAVIDRWDVGLGYLWTVAVEAQFYLLWALVVAAAVRTRRPHAVLAGAAVLGIAVAVSWRLVQVRAGATTLDPYMGTVSRLDAPLMGALAGVALVAGWLPAIRGRVAAAGGAIGLAGLAFAATRLDPDDTVLYRGLFTGLAAAAALAVVAAIRSHPGLLRRMLVWRPLRAAGVTSYSLYVWHVPVFEIVAKNTVGWLPLARVALAVALTTAAAVASYRLVEQPFRRRAVRS